MMLSLRFVVNDTGVGMNEEFLPHMFEPFSQESTGTTALYGGTGLGSGHIQEYRGYDGRENYGPLH